MTLEHLGMPESKEMLKNKKGWAHDKRYKVTYTADLEQFEPQTK